MNEDIYSNDFHDLFNKAFAVASYVATASNKKIHIRGRKIFLAKEYEKLALEACKEDLLKPQPFFGYSHLPYESGARNFVLCGVPGTGKTTIVDMLSQSILRGFVGNANYNHRAIVHDHKGESIALMYGMGFTFENGLLKTLNPFDSNCVYWDVAKDFDNDLFARVFAEILIDKKENESQPFFPDSAREIVTALVRSLNTIKRHRWKFYDIVRLCYLSPLAELIATLKIRDDNYGIVETLTSQSEKTTDSILSTLRTEIGKYKEIAALWAKAKEGVTVLDFLSNSYVLLLGSYSLAEEAIGTVNRLFVTRLLEAFLCGEKISISDQANPNRTWLIFDEAPMLGNLKRLPKALDLGRQLGLAVVFCFHDIHQLTSVYGELTKSLLAKFQNRLIFKLGDIETAKWASELFGSEEILDLVPDINYSESNQTLRREIVAGGNCSSSQSIKINKTVSQLILPEEFFDLPLANPQNGLICYLSTVIGQTKVGLYWSFINKMRPQPSKDAPLRNFVDLSKLTFPKN
jgi:type IV secretory pathway TraG/TraD family ATPase VirD4